MAGIALSIAVGQGVTNDRYNKYTFGSDKKFLNLDCGNDYTTLLIYFKKKSHWITSLKNMLVFLLKRVMRDSIHWFSPKMATAVKPSQNLGTLS